MTQGSRTTNQIINLDDDLIDKRLAKPQKVFLTGREWTVRRDLTAEEIYEFWAKVSANDADAALVILMGEEAKGLNEKLLVLPGIMYTRKIHQLIAVAGLRRGDEPQESAGESTPS